MSGDPASDVPVAEDKMRVGTLVYTKAGLATLFFWLLWGDFCFTLMEILAPSLLPILLREHNATNSEIALLVGTLASVLTMIMTAIASVKSDRHRGPNGRRIPFLFWPTPLIAILLAAIPFAPEETRFVLSTPVARSLHEGSPVSHSLRHGGPAHYVAP